MSAATGLWTCEPLAPGEHACWLVDPADDYAADAGSFVAHGVSAGDKVLIVGDPPGSSRPDRSAAVVMFDPRAASARQTGGTAAATGAAGPVGTSVLDAVRREARAAGREGFRALRVLAQMERIAPHDATFTELVDHELRIEELAAASGAAFVCVYRRDLWEAPLLSDITCVHLRRVGSVPQSATFRILRAEAGCWAVDGVVDLAGAAAFGTALRAAAALNGPLRLSFDKLELIDAAGLRALVDAARATPNARVVISNANETVRRVWTLSGYDDPRVPVELQP